MIPGDAAFRLYDTYGVPLDFIEDLAASRKLRVDRAAFERAMEAQRARARAGSGGTFAAKTHDVTVESVAHLTASIHAEVVPADSLFVGYDTTTAEGKINRLFRPTDGGKRLEPADALDAGESGYAALDRTPFYLEAGGQVSDTGRLLAGGGIAAVKDMLRPAPDWPRLHVATVREGALQVGDKVTAEVDAARRDDIRRNHTATHLLHAALREVVGPHVQQAGSLVASDRLRFDVKHFEPITPDDLTKIERLVNGHVFRNQTVLTEERSKAEAIKDGAMALFGEKYGDRVRVVTVPDFSVELCGGTHCRATGDIGPFVITHEGGVAAGVRRIEAVTGMAAVEEFQNRGDQAAGLGTVADQAVAAVEQLDNLRFRRPVNTGRAKLAVETVTKLAKRAKAQEREIERLKMQAAMGGAGETAADDTVDIAGAKLVTREVPALEPQALRTLADSLRDRVGSGVVVLASRNAGKAALVVSVTPDLVDRVHAGQLVKTLAPIIGGRGGGRPDFAQAGGRQPERIGELFTACRELLGRTLAVRGETPRRTATGQAPG